MAIGLGVDSAERGVGGDVADVGAIVHHLGRLGDVVLLTSHRPNLRLGGRPEPGS